MSSLEPIILNVLPGTVHTISEIIPREAFEPNMSYQKVIPDIVNLLGAPMTKKSKLATSTAKRP